MPDLDFDYIIVGAGSSGCVLAHRLSENPSHRVLILEAGKKDSNWLIHIPMGVAKIWNQDCFNWSYYSEPEPHMENRKLYHPRGKVLGGSSAINMMAYVRGNSGDYDRWAQMGLTDWSYERVLPYFRKAEAFIKGANDYHGENGPLKTQPNPSTDPLMEAYFEAGKAAGLPVTDDFNGAEQEGLARMQFNIGNGRRQSAAVAFLHPILKRPNLTLMTEANVDRIDFEGTKAKGITYTQGGQSVMVTAARDVIVASGAFNSPQLLMRSGVGPAAHLQEAGIRVVADRQNVGGNLQDHPSVMIEFKRKRRSDFHRELRLDRLSFNMLRALFKRDGPATMPLGFGTGFVKSAPEVALPDIQLFFRLFSVHAHDWFPVVKPAGMDGLGLLACHLRPESRGTVRLDPKNPNGPPRILNNLLSTDYDRRAMRYSFKLMRTLAGAASFEKDIEKETLPGREVEGDDEIDAFIRQSAVTVYHPVGTCRMGIDDASVVDPDLKVRGCQNLRVVDASVMPDIVGGNLNAPVMMIADKASDIILGRDQLPAVAP